MAPIKPVCATLLLVAVQLSSAAAASVTYDFESVSELWGPVAGSYEWTRQSGGTPSSGTGPSSGYGGRGYYYFTETSSPRVSGDIFKLNYSPAAGACSGGATVSFFYFMKGSTIGSLQLIDATGYAAWSLTGDQGSTAWTEASADVPTPSFAFAVQRGSDWSGDVAVDQVTVSCAPPSSTAPPPLHPRLHPRPPPPWALTLQNGQLGYYEYNWPKSVAVDAQGFSYFGGQYSGPGFLDGALQGSPPVYLPNTWPAGFVPTSWGMDHYVDGFLTKVSPDGVVRWAVGLAGGSTNSRQHVRQVKVGSMGVYASGFFQAKLTIAGHHHHCQKYCSSTTCCGYWEDSIFVVKYSGGGAFQWVIPFDATSTDSGTVGLAMEVDASDNVLV